MTDDNTTQKIANFFNEYPLHTFQKRQLLIRAEETPPGVFYITEGRMSQYDITPGGDEVVVNVFKPGAFFPMSAAINHTPNQYFFEASTVVSARQAPLADAVAFLQNNPDVTFDLLARVYRGVDGVLRRMAHLMGGNAHSRLIFELLNAANRFGEPQANGSVIVTLTESELAKHSGLTRETVSRTLQQLKSDELITVSASGITLTQPKELEARLGAGL